VATNLAQQLPDSYFQSRGTATSRTDERRRVLQAAKAEKQYVPAKVENQAKKEFPAKSRPIRFPRGQ
jgi:hypothetical protein